ncbi:DUF2975 domain-containing protein [Pseudolysobacter antarcticus]|nr:DUF2975 domain-containing protein [Pseudolysobacter antarcticus]
MARWLRYAVLLMMIATVLGNVLVAWPDTPQAADARIALTTQVPEALAGHRWLILIDSVAVSLILLLGLYRLLRLMRLFEQGDFFSRAAALHLRAFALALLLSTLASCLMPGLELLIVRLAGLDAPTSISFSIDSADIWLIMIGAVFFMITWIMGEARQLAEDNRMIV